MAPASAAMTALVSDFITFNVLGILCFVAGELPLPNFEINKTRDC